MTIASATSKLQYNCNGSITEFSFPHKIFESSDLEVYLLDADGNETQLTETTDYSVDYASGYDFTNGALIITEETYASGNKLTIKRVIPMTQETDLNENDNLPSDTLENSLDRAVMLAQQIAEELSRAILAPASEPSSSRFELPDINSRAGMLLAFDSVGAMIATQSIGIWRGNWSTGSGYNERDIIQDSSNYNLYMATGAYTSGASVSADVTNGDLSLILDAETILSEASSAKDDAETAATTATAAQAAAEVAQAAAETAETNAEAAQSAAETAESNAETAANDFSSLLEVWNAIEDTSDDALKDYATVSRIWRNGTRKLTGLYVQIGTVATGTSPTFKVRKYTGGAWVDMTSTITVPSSADSEQDSSSNIVTDITISNGDILGLQIVSEGSADAEMLQIQLTWEV
jgi:hypothetical protein